jgi:2-polyprenyl-3-methyl-5-hydroxy-6-metoxy-1,4-benzoquinol methylase
LLFEGDRAGIHCPLDARARSIHLGVPNTRYDFLAIRRVSAGGRDYGNPAEVEIYDSTHADFRDVEAESKELLDLLGLASSDVLIDFGSGTGTFAIASARRCARVHSVDVSQAIIDYAKAKANTAGISNLVFSHAGFSDLRTSR